MRIDRFRFGSVRIDGVDYTHDLIILGGVVQSPWVRTAGGHVFAPVDLAKLIDAAPEVVCLGTGAVGMVTIETATIEAFERAGTEVIVDRTGKIIDVFNTLVGEGRDVAAALHLTC
ncbi:MAG: MTH938/NDUFAF3 family protein [Candidatus Sulfomarinibacteraceae bacterium]